MAIPESEIDAALAYVRAKLVEHELYNPAIGIVIRADRAARVAVDTIAQLQLPPWMVLLTINVFLLAVGCFIDTASSILVLTPLLLPIAQAIGVDPIHFGIIVVTNLSIGTFTPPFGINIFVGQAVFKAPLSSIYPGVLPFIGVALGALAVVTYIPQLSLWILRFL